MNRHTITNMTKLFVVVGGLSLQVRFSKDLAVFLVVLVQDSGKICATLPTGEEAKRRKLRLTIEVGSVTELVFEMLKRATKADITR